MLKMLLPALALSLSFSGVVHAQEETTAAEGETKIKIEDAADKKNKVAGDIDEEIANKKLRAESGSKSKWSLSLDTTFNAGGLDKPLDDKRPDLYGRPGTQKVSSLTVGPDIRYRWSKNDSITLGTSIGVSTPLQGKVSQKDQTRVGDPTLGYAHVSKMGSLQSIISGGASYATSPESLSIDNTVYGFASWTLMRTFQNGLSLGLTGAVDNLFYSNAPGGNAANRENTGYGGDDRQDYSIALYPTLEFEFNDVLSFRTVTRYTTWYHYYGDSAADRLIHYPGTQSAGIGIAVTRDLYLYPNVQFLFQDIRSDRTNVALTANINVF